jgi:hypothetical protein
VSRRRRRAVIVGEGASVGIGRRPGAREHEWRSGKLAGELAGAVDVRRVLPTVTSTSPEEGNGRRKQLELGRLTARELAVGLERAQATGVAKQKGEEDKASLRGSYCGGEVAAGRCSGKPWRARSKTAGREIEPGSRRR